ncbi:hypothetical protein E2C01_021158 [Portunus trituberculatus]|uniref:Uncharacterized protein n=1 Tax=Portunus trituberculatus TaxID=210409 RepID=A0A5B7E483_PORTR|nr:hypothetical protein [Portunus trituberculatus]
MVIACFLKYIPESSYSATCSKIGNTSRCARGQTFCRASLAAILGEGCEGKLPGCGVLLRRRL